MAELHSFITKLHEYNEMKDTGQMLLGRIGKIIFLGLTHL